MQDANISNFMIRYPHTIKPDLGLRDALDFMREQGIRHLPIVEDDRLKGVVSERDLRVAIELPQASNLTVSDVMKQGVFAVTPDTPLSEVAGEMADNKLGSVLIVNSAGHVMGIFTTTDALRLLANMAEDGSIEDYLIDYESYEAVVPGQTTVEW